MAQPGAPSPTTTERLIFIRDDKARGQQRRDRERDAHTSDAGRPPEAIEQLAEHRAARKSAANYRHTGVIG